MERSPLTAPEEVSEGDILDAVGIEKWYHQQFNLTRVAKRLSGIYSSLF